MKEQHNEENQNLEWNESWRDEYLRWLCRFANAEGGTLVIGKADDGTIVGVPNVYRLMEDLPNKIRDLLGIVAKINMQEIDGKNYLEITVDPYPNPISYKGEYHIRSGSTKQELSGKFTLPERRRAGRPFKRSRAPGLFVGYSLANQGVLGSARILERRSRASILDGRASAGSSWFPSL